MATIIGSLRPDATTGEIELLNRLRELPDACIVWPELAVYDKYPDFVILMPDRGVAVLEVKDWVEVTYANPATFTIRTRAGEERHEPNPISAVRDKAFAIQRKLAGEPRLCHDGGPHHGHLRLPYAYAVVFPRLSEMFLFPLRSILDNPRCFITQDQLARLSAVDLLERLDWLFRPDLSADDIDLVRRTLHPEITITAGDRVLGVMDVTQEQAAKEGLFEAPAPQPADDLPEDGHRLATNPVIRLVRGVAGSGKTLVLARRARYLAGLYPDWRILVLTFNRGLAHSLRDHFPEDDQRLTVTHFHQLCRDLLDEMGDWGGGPVSDRLGTINHLLPDLAVPERLDAKFLDGEIRWIKETGLTAEQDYLNAARTGRGRPLSRADRQLVYDIYRRYQANMDMRRRFDWEDPPVMIAWAIRTGRLPGGRYEAILIDEAQDFAPTWFRVLRLLLNPATAMMFMAADGAQRIYRAHSWRSLGLHVVGRTRILPRPYRMTYEIARAAAELVRGHSAFIVALANDDEVLPHSHLDPDRMRHGPPPELRLFPTRAREQSWLRNRLNELQRLGYAPEEIAIFLRKTALVDAFAANLRLHHWPVRVLKGEAPVGDDGLTVGTMHAAKGLEYRAVFLPQLQMLFSGDAPSPEERQVSTLDELRLLYVAMTRARERVYMTHEGRLPPELGHLARHLDER